MSPTEPCPICSAGIAECDHELVRWSYVAGEFEPCALLRDVEMCIGVAHAALRWHLTRPRPPNDEGLNVLYESCRNRMVCGEALDDVLDDTDVVGYALNIIEALPGVIRVDEGSAEHPETLVLWSADPEQVREGIHGVIRKLEIDTSRESVVGWTAGELEALRGAAVSALRSQIPDPKLWGPYRWGAAESPRVNLYRAGEWPPLEHVVYFLALPRVPDGLYSSTVVVLDERDQSVVTIGSAGDEG